MYIRATAEKLLSIPELQPMLNKYMVENRERFVDSEGLTNISFKDLYEDAFKLLYSQGVKLDDTMFYMEIDASLLEELVPEDFPYWYRHLDKEDNPIPLKFKDWFMTYMTKDDKALVLIEYKSTDIGRDARIKDTELRQIITKFGNEDLSNIYTYTSTIATKKAEYEEGIDEI